MLDGRHFPITFYGCANLAFGFVTISTITFIALSRRATDLLEVLRLLKRRVSADDFYHSGLKARPSPSTLEGPCHAIREPWDISHRFDIDSGLGRQRSELGFPAVPVK